MSTKRRPHSTPLRRIAVYVDEPEPGWFAWTLIEAGEDVSSWSSIETTDEWVHTYKNAMTAGLLALQAMVDDLDRGPREAPPTKPQKSSGSTFGFGFGGVLP